MRTLAIVSVFIFGFLVSACKSSTEANKTYFDDTSVQPKVGLKFVYLEEQLNAKGNAVEPGNECDYLVSFSDTTHNDSSRVNFYITDWRFYVPAFNLPSIRYLANHDVEVLDERSGELWVRLPISSNMPWRYEFDTIQIDPSDTFAIHAYDTAFVPSLDVSDVIIANKTIYTRTVEEHFREIDIELPRKDTTITRRITVMHYAPSLGFFTKIEDCSPDGGRATARITLQRCELK